MLWNLHCQYGCGYIHLSGASQAELKNCCMTGSTSYASTQYPHLRPLPSKLSSYIQDTANFSRISSTYNNILAMGATGVENDRGGGFERDMFGPHAVKLNGRMYHFLPSITSSTTDPSCGLSYFTFDAQAAMIRHVQTLHGSGGIGHDYVREAIVQDIYNEIKHINFLCQELQVIGHGVQSRNSTNLVAEINASINYFEVAQITSNFATGNRCLRVKLSGLNQSSVIPITSKFLEPLSYPLFFPYAETGWCPDIRQSLNFMSYLSSRILLPEFNADGTPFMCKSLTDPHVLIHCNRFQAAARLKQVYLVDMVSRAIDFRLQWHSNNQSVVFGGETQSRYNRDLHVQEILDESDQKTFLSSSFHGGKRHLKQLACSALSVVSELGNPTLFITLTCNPNWPEIQDRLLQGQTAFDREDIVCQVFKLKLDLVLKNTRTGKYFGNHQVAYIMRVIEYQHRGMPHAHIVLKLKDVPCSPTSDENAIANWIDQYISARMPGTLHGQSTRQDVKYRVCVETHMLHKCAVAVNGCKDSSTCKCKRGYDDTTLQSQTSFDDRGFPVYKRDFECDLDVVLHSKLLLLDWEGHANVEYAGNSQCVLYLYKYLYKGAKQVKVNVTSSEESEHVDEIKIYLRGRFLCAMDAMWRTLGYQTYPRSSPSVQTIKVKMQGMVQSLLHDGKSCDMLVYFNRPHLCYHMKYAELFARYTVSKKLSTRFDENTENTLNGYFTITITGLDPLYLQHRQQSTPSITRLEMVYITAGKTV